MRRWPYLLFLSIAAVLTVTGCGTAPVATAEKGEQFPPRPASYSQYVSRLVDLYFRIHQPVLERGLDAIPLDRPAATASVSPMVEAEGALRALIRRIEAKAPPEALLAQHAKLLADLKAAADGLQMVQKGAAEADRLLLGRGKVLYSSNINDANRVVGSIQRQAP